MPKENHFEVEYAKSSMATCRVCMAKVPKGALRIGHIQLEAGTEVPPAPLLENDATAAAMAKTDEDKRAAIVAGATRWHHFECFSRMRGSKWMAANLPRDPKSIQRFSEIKKPDQKKVVQLWKAMLVSAGGKATGGTASSELKSTGTRKASGSAADAASKKQAKAEAAEKMARLTSPKGVLSAKDHKRVRALEAELAATTAAKLHAELELNHQVRSGKKDELVQRVAEGRVLGALPKCPRCEMGRIHWSRIGGWHSCPGYYDKDLGIAKRCYFRAQSMKRKKWKLK